MSNPLISVLIPVYREGEILRDTIDSAMNQSYQDFEIVLVENNADELSLNILKEYATRFPTKVRLVSQPVQGAPSARNKGLKESRGQYIAMLEGDDVMYPNRLERQLAVFEKYKGEISLLSSEYDLVNWENNRVIEKSKKKKKFWMTCLELEDLFDSHPSTWFFKKEKAISIGMFNEIFNPRLVEDDEFNFKMFLSGNILCMEEHLVRVRLPSEDYLSIKDAQAPPEQVLYKLNNFFSILKCSLGSQSSIRYNENGFRKIKSQWLREQGIAFFSYKNGRAVGRKLILDAIIEQKFDLKNWKAFLRSYLGSRYSKNIKERSISENELSFLMKNEFFILK